MSVLGEPKGSLGVLRVQGSRRTSAELQDPVGRGEVGGGVIGSRGGHGVPGHFRFKSRFLGARHGPEGSWGVLRVLTGVQRTRGSVHVQIGRPAQSGQAREPRARARLSRRRWSWWRRWRPEAVEGGRQRASSLPSARASGPFGSAPPAPPRSRRLPAPALVFGS